MTLWEFLDKNLVAVLIGGLFLLYVAVKTVYPIFRKPGGKGLGVSKLKLGPVEMDGSDKYTIEGLMLENRVLAQITRKIADFENRILLQRQMGLVDEYLESLVNQVNDAFRKFLASKNIKRGEFYDDLIHDNDRVMSETLKSLKNRLRVAMRQNGFAHKNPAEMREYVRIKFKALHDYANEIRQDVAFDEETVATEFITWNHGASESYFQQALDLFTRCAEIALDCERQVECLQAEYKLVEKTFLETGKIPDLSNVCTDD